MWITVECQSLSGKSKRANTFKAKHRKDKHTCHQSMTFCLHSSAVLLFFYLFYLCLASHKLTNTQHNVETCVCYKNRISPQCVYVYTSRQTIHIFDIYGILLRVNNNNNEQYQKKKKQLHNI